MRILMDVDGVLADFVTPALKAAGMPGLEFHQWDFIGELPMENRVALFKALEDPMFWANQKPIVGAKLGLQAIRQSGHELIFCTSPWVSCFGWESTRRQWLIENMDYSSKRDGLIFTGAKRHVAADLIVDDKPSYIADWTAANSGKKGFLFDQPYNRSFNFPRFDWAHIPEDLL